VDAALKNAYQEQDCAMAQEYDVVFIGAGHNGLTAAAYLAKAGLSVCLVERAPFAGGAVNTLEVTLPGFKHDTGSVGHVMIQANPLIVQDELGLISQFGLKYIYPEAATAALFPDDSALMIYHDVDRTCESIAQFSEHDAEAYRNFYEMCQPLTGLLAQGTFNPPVAFGALMAQLETSEIGRALERTILMSSADLVDEWFESEKLKLHLMKYSTEQMISPWTIGSALSLFFGVPMNHAFNTGTPEGGSGELATALVKCVEHYGGKILLNSEVVGVNVAEGRATGIRLASGETIAARKAVVSNLDPRPLFNDLVAADATTPELRTKVNHIKDAEFCGVMSHLALDSAPRFRAGPEPEKAFMIEPLPWMDEFRSVFEDLSHNRLPKSKVPLLVVNSMHDGSRAPAGKHVAYLWEYEPWRPNGQDPSTWDQLKDQVSDDVIAFVGRYVDNFGPDQILGRVVHSPIDYPRMNPNLVHGGVTGPMSSALQMFGNRPIPELGQYRTPIEGLYLVGHAMHPGGAVSGGGRAMVQILMSDLDIDFDDVVSGSILASH
jgi:phytoene dehydrogenase-like protein